MISSRNQNQLPFFFTPLGDLLKALMFLSNLNSFNSFPSSTIQGFSQRKGSSKVWKEKGSKWFSHFLSLSPLLVFVFALLVCFAFLLWVSLVLCIALFNMFLFVYFQFWFILVFIKQTKKFEKSEKYKNSMCLCTLVLVYLGWPLKQSFLNFVSFVA